MGRIRRLSRELQQELTDPLVDPAEVDGGKPDRCEHHHTGDDRGQLSALSHRTIEALPATGALHGTPQEQRLGNISQGVPHAAVLAIYAIKRAM